MGLWILFKEFGIGGERKYLGKSINLERGTGSVCYFIISTLNSANSMADYVY